MASALKFEAMNPNIAKVIASIAVKTGKFAQPSCATIASSKADVVKLGGPMTDDAGDMAGSLLILDVADRAAAEAFTAADPYSLAGLFERVEIRPIRITLGKP